MTIFCPQKTLKEKRKARGVFEATVRKKKRMSSKLYIYTFYLIHDSLLVDVFARDFVQRDPIFHRGEFDAFAGDGVGYA